MLDTLVRPRSTLIQAPALAVAPALSCVVAEGGADAAWVRVAGELDLATAPTLRQSLELATTRARRVVLDLRGLTFMDASGIHVIFAASRRAEADGKRMVIVSGQGRVDRLFEMTGTAERLEIVDLGLDEPPVQALVVMARHEGRHEHDQEPSCHPPV